MKAENLLDEIGKIDDGIIAESNTEMLQRKPAKRIWLRWISAVAACLVVAIAALQIFRQVDDFSKLPILEINEHMGDFGFEGFAAYDISELYNGNPWSENDKIKTLPVFKNPVVHDEWGPVIKDLPVEEMVQKAHETAFALGLVVDSVSTSSRETTALCKDVTIIVEINGALRIFFEKSISLPAEYSFTNYNTSEQQAKDVMQYLLKQYEPIVGMKSPALDLSGSYDIDGRYHRSYEAFESSDNLEESILGYNFNRVEFALRKAGELWIIDRYSEDLSQKIGDYPIVSAQEARELLLQNYYITSVSEELPDAKYIAYVELIYRVDQYSEVYMPYYRFLVELPEMKRENGLRTFGAFYVPAVEEKYLGNMPVWDGRFN